jgi:hypothetical protein
MADSESVTNRILRDIQRTLVGLTARFDAQREELTEIRGEVARLGARIDSMRDELKEGFRQQHAVLAHNSILITSAHL